MSDIGIVCLSSGFRLAKGEPSWTVTYDGTPTVEQLSREELSKALDLHSSMSVLAFKTYLNHKDLIEQLLGSEFADNMSEPSACTDSTTLTIDENDA